jgi:hypothetical protein
MPAISYTRLVVDIGTGQETVEQMSPAEIADLQEMAAEGARAEAKEADRAAAGRDIKKLARQGKQVDAATFARYAGIDVNAPDPTAPGGG